MKKVFAYAHTHWDREWYRTFEDFRVRLVEVFDGVLKKLEKNELKSFYFDGQTAALEDYLEIRPEKTDLVKSLVREKRLFIGPYYCSTDSFLVNAESLIRNLQKGLKTSKEFGCEDFIGYHADTFGHSAQIPEIVKYFDIKYGIFWRGCGENPSEFEFNGLKSVYLIQGYFQDFFSMKISPEKKAELLEKTLEKIAKYSSGKILLPLGADHLALFDEPEKQVAQVNKFLKNYEIELTTPFEYLKQVKFDKKITCEQRSNARNFILPGVYSSRIDLKQANSAMEWDLYRITEPLNAIMAYLGKTGNYQAVLEYAGDLLLKNHPHDSIYGCSLDEVHAENLMRFEKVKQTLNSVKNSIFRGIYTENSIKVFNFSNFAQSGVFKVCSTKKLDAQLVGKHRNFPFLKIYPTDAIPVTEDFTQIYEYLFFARDVEPFSCAEPSNPCNDLITGDNFIENDNLKLEISGGKINITDKITGKTHPDFIKIIDRADIGDSYNFGALKGDKKIHAEIVSTKIVEKGPYRAAMELKLSIKIPKNSNRNGRSKRLINHLIKMTAYLESGAEFVEFSPEWVNKSTDHILQVEFNLENSVETTISDDLTGVVERKFDPDYDIYKYVPAPRGLELKYNIAPAQSFVCAQNTGIISDRTLEYEVFKNKIALTLLRATGTISNPHNPTRGTPAGPPLPTPDLQMCTKRADRFAVTFKTEKIYALSEKFKGALVGIHSDFTTEGLFSSGNEKILLSAMKINDKNQLILRFINISDELQYFDFVTKLPCKQINILNALEEFVKPYQPLKLEKHAIIAISVSA